MNIPADIFEKARGLARAPGWSSIRLMILLTLGIIIMVVAVLEIHMERNHAETTAQRGGGEGGGERVKVISRAFKTVDKSGEKFDTDSSE
jgi:hypothetical protein